MLNIGLLQQAQRRVAPALAPAGRVVHQADPLVALLLDVVDHERRLDAVVERNAEDIALRLLRVTLDDVLGRGDRVHQRHLLLLGDVDDGERHARIHRADDSDDVVASDETGDVLHALGRLGLVVVDHRLDRLAFVAALGVVLLQRQLEAHQGGLAVVVGAAGERNRETDLDRVGSQRAAGSDQPEPGDQTARRLTRPASCAHTYSSPFAGPFPAAATESRQRKDAADYKNFFFEHTRRFGSLSSGLQVHWCPSPNFGFRPVAACRVLEKRPFAHLAMGPGADARRT